MSDGQDYERLSRAAYSPNASADDVQALARFLRQREEAPVSSAVVERAEVVSSGGEAGVDNDPPRRVRRRALISAVALFGALAVLASGIFIGRASNNDQQALPARPLAEEVGDAPSLAVFDSPITKTFDTSVVGGLFDESQAPAIKRLLYEDDAVQLIAARGYRSGMPDGEQQICLIVVPRPSDGSSGSCLTEDEFEKSGLVSGGLTGAVLYKWGPTGGPMKLLCDSRLLEC